MLKTKNWVEIREIYILMAAKRFFAKHSRIHSMNDEMREGAARASMDSLIYLIKNENFPFLNRVESGKVIFLVLDFIKLLDFHVES